LLTLLKDDPERTDLYERTQSLLRDLRDSRSHDGQRYAILKSAMDRAERLAADNKLQQARTIWKSVVELYGPDPRAREQVDLAKARLSKKVITSP